MHAQASMDDTETHCNSLSKPEDAPGFPPSRLPAPAVAPDLAPAPTPAPASTTSIAPAPAPPATPTPVGQGHSAASPNDETAPSYATAPSTVTIKGILKPRGVRKSPKAKGVKVEPCTFLASIIFAHVLILCRLSHLRFGLYFFVSRLCVPCSCLRLTNGFEFCMVQGTVLVRWPQKFASSIKLNVSQHRARLQATRHDHGARECTHGFLQARISRLDFHLSY